ncbi:MAG: energy-coupling factor ABC transporter permease [Chloroflexota bacterium]|nr:energy-coupling factor ABC transporter permease [Chloroflexota bacterium]
MLAAPAPMHIPDGFLSVLVSIVLWIISIIVIAYSLKRVNEDLDERKVVLMGVMAATIFAGQMLNFTVVGGTSGHLMGAAIATILLGPWAAVLVMTSVVAVQALIFQDGGLVVMGANIFNMAVIGVAVSFFVYRTVRSVSGDRKWGIYVGGFAAAWFSVVAAALAAALELAISGTSPANIAIPAMAGIHALIGIGEGLITLGALALVGASRPDLLQVGEGKTASSAVLWLAGLAIAIALAIAAPLASSNPDGLEFVAEQQGFLELAREPLYELIPDYVFPGLSNEALATIIAGIVGALLVFGVAIIVAYSRRKAVRQPVMHSDKPGEDS